MPSSSIAELLQKALTLHRAGAVAAAAAAYGEVLRGDPSNSDAHYYLAMISCQSGRFAEGADLARKSLAVDPKHARAHVLLGRALGALGQHEEALASFDGAITLAPDLPEAHSHRADVLSALGRNVEAIESYDRALTLAPDLIEDRFNRAATLSVVGRNEEAISSLDHVIAARPEFAQAHVLRAKVVSDIGRQSEALQSVDRALALEPGLAEAWVGRGNVLANLNRFDDAFIAYDRALELEAGSVEARLGRGKAYLAVGKPELGMEDAARALEREETLQTRSFFAECAKLAPFTATNSERFRGLVLRALAEGWARPYELAGACVSLIKLNDEVSDCITRANAAWPARLPSAELFGASGLAALAQEGLLALLLECNPIADIGLERLLTNVRCIMLKSADVGTDAGADVLNETVLGFYCAVARQCFVNEFVYAVAADEAEQAQRLRSRLEAALATDKKCPTLWPAVVGAYFSLGTLANAAALCDGGWPQCVEALIEQQIKERAEEHRIAATVPALTGIDNDVSRAVREQYEESPYPRWVKAGPPTQPSNIERESLPVRDVLIAGCGTGRFAIEFARQARQARFLAVDLSLASLSYAKRMAQRFDVANLEFAQADILKLGSTGLTFDFIESSGVLHHLADPWQGWRVLLAMLRPGGTMQVGLYSELARQGIVAARAMIADHGYQASPEDIRRCREEIMVAENGTLLKAVTAWADFFTLSECRDLLFHVQEHRTTVPEIKSFLAANNVQFAGFILDASVRRQFAARFADPGAATDLDCWHAFERDAPQSFVGMYRFWVRKPQ